MIQKIRQACDACRADKVKCDRVLPVCSRCLAKSSRKTISARCTYSEERKRGPKIQRLCQQNDSNLKIYSEPATKNLDLCPEQLNPIFLSKCLEVFEKSFPIINRDDLCFGVESLRLSDLTQTINKFEWKTASACELSLWACCAIGAFLLGNKAEAKRFSEKTDDSYNQEIMLNSNSGFRAGLLLSLMFKVIGLDQKALIRVSQTEIYPVEPWQKGALKACKIILLPVNQLLNSFDQLIFQDEELESFSFDSRVYLQTYLPFFKYAVFQDTLWNYASNVHANLILAETHLKIQPELSLRNWYRLQPRLLFLEIAQLGMLTEGIERTKNVVKFLFERQEFLSLLEGSRDAMLLILEVCLQIFHKIQDAEYYYLSLSLFSLVHQCCFSAPSLDAEWKGIGTNPVLNIMREKMNRAFQAKEDSKMCNLPSIEALTTPTCSLLTLIEYSESL